jgi:L-ribulose-5-phosphate 3-epimerase
MMQGRLLPPVGGRIQSFPGDQWPTEFPLLRQLGYDAIELTIEQASWDVHPVRHKAGRAQLTELAAGHDIHLVGLCGDNFMELPLVADDEAVRRQSLAQLLDLLEHGAVLGLAMIEVPMMGANSLRPDAARAHFAEAMTAALPRAEALGIDIVLESDLAPAQLAALMDEFDHPRLGINYDMGNSTWFGFDPEDELPRYHRHVRNVHVKDCTRKDYSVALGSGETRFDRVFALLARFDYRRDFVLQAARQGDDVQAGRDYLEFVRRCLSHVWPAQPAAHATTA